MSLYIYDEALIQKLKYWTQKTQINVYNVDEANRLIQVMANKTNDESIKLPIIALRRSNGFKITNPNKKPTSYGGFSIKNEYQIEYEKMKIKLDNGEITEEYFNSWTGRNQEKFNSKEIANLTAIPIEIEYKLDVYTRYQKENDIYMRNLIFNIINFPTFAVHFTYEDIPIEHNANIYLRETVSNENPDIKLFQDQICKQTLQIYITDAYLWNIKKTYPKTISFEDIYVPGLNSEEYNPTYTYNIGDYCKYDGMIYECIKPYESGTLDDFDQEYWKEVGTVPSDDKSCLQIWDKTDFITENF